MINRFFETTPILQTPPFSWEKFPLLGGISKTQPLPFIKGEWGGGGGVQQVILCFYTKKNWEL